MHLTKLQWANIFQCKECPFYYHCRKEDRHWCPIEISSNAIQITKKHRHELLTANSHYGNSFFYLHLIYSVCHYNKRCQTVNNTCIVFNLKCPHKKKTSKYVNAEKTTHSQNSMRYRMSCLLLFELFGFFAWWYLIICDICGNNIFRCAVRTAKWCKAKLQRSNKQRPNY